jgi:23S rRNA pseudouridine2605 synthase
VKKKSASRIKTGFRGKITKSGKRKSRMPNRPVREKKATVTSAVPRRPNQRYLFTTGASTKKSQQIADASPTEGHRLQKVLAAAGFGSRRECEELITTGRVAVDHQTVTELGVRVNPMTQEIRVDGELLKKTRPIYIALYKPKGYVCTNYDPERRPRAIDLVPEKMGRLFSIGRLDLESEGLLLMTNDGALSERLTHPKYEVPKRYRVQVAGLVEPSIIAQLKKCVYFSEGHAKASHVTI